MALRQITDKAQEFGVGPLFNKILPLLMEHTLEDQECHLLIKATDHILYKLDDLICWYLYCAANCYHDGMCSPAPFTKPCQLHRPWAV